MAEQKKDLTGLMDYAKAMQDAGHAPPVPAGSVMEEQKIDKVDDFESLEDYGKANPTPEPSADFASEMPSEEAFAPSIADGPAEILASGETSPPPSLTSESAFVTTPPEAPHFDAVGSDLSPEIPPSELIDFSDTPPFDVDLAVQPDAPTVPTVELTRSILTTDPHKDAGFNLVSDVEVISNIVEAGQPVEPIQTPIREPLRPAIKPYTAPKAPLEKVKQYSEQLSPGKAAAPAAFPFSLLITGRLAPEEKERLTDLLSRENMGIRELDLEPQFECGKVLIPRISEYAAVMLISALRSTQATMRLGPSDTIFATPDTQDSNEEDLDMGDHTTSTTYNSDGSHAAEDLPITTDTFLPGHIRHAVVDIVTASAAMKTLVIEAESSPEYQTLLEALQRELKYKAFRKGATAIVGFAVHLTQMHLPTHYRIMVTGSAIKTPGN